MKIYLPLIILTLSTTLTIGQSIGLRIDKEISNTKSINNSLGFGLFINFDDFSKKFVVITYGDLTNRKWEYNNMIFEEVLTNYTKGVIGATGLFVKPINKFINFRIGPDLNHSWVEYSLHGKVANWIVGYKANFIGFGFTTNFNIHKIFNLPFNLDLFVTPNYLVNIKDYEYRAGIEKYEKNLKIINIQIGISFILAENNQ